MQLNGAIGQLIKDGDAYNLSGIRGHGACHARPGRHLGGLHQRHGIRFLRYERNINQVPITKANQ